MKLTTNAENIEQPHSAAAGFATQRKNNPGTIPAGSAGITQQRRPFGTGDFVSPPIQKADPDDKDLLQGKFPLQKQPEEEKDLMQGKFPEDHSRIPASVQTKMEGALGTSLSSVNVHPDSSKATEVGALAYTQGTDIHIAPGHYQPSTASGKQLLGHELTHVAQQMEGRVQPTGSVGGLPLNDNPALEREADSLGAKAV